MALIPWIGLVVFVLAVVGIVIAFSAFKVQRDEYRKTGKHPKGHFVGMGMALGLPLGFAVTLPIGIALGNIVFAVTLGPGFGLAIGLALGAHLEKKHEKELRPLTEKEKKIHRISMLLLIGLLLLGVTVFALLNFM
ncbi:MAG: hypothetical protein ABH851_04080 [Methanobacteriota archaeon]